MNRKPDYTHIDSMSLMGRIEHGMCCQSTIVVTWARMLALIGAIHNELEELSLDPDMIDALPVLRLMEILHQMASGLPQVNEVAHVLDAIRADLLPASRNDKPVF